MMATPDAPDQTQASHNDSTTTAQGPDDSREEQPLAQFHENLQQLLNDPATNASWVRFTIVLEDITKTTHETLGIRTNPTPAQQRPDQSEQAEARRIQRQYRVNRRRAIRNILGQTHTTCPVDTNTLEDHFRRTWDTVEYMNGAYRQQDRPDIDSSNFTEEEVKTRLNEAENTAPGPDRITYSNWRKIDPGAKTITMILNICARHRRTPTSWRNTDTVLIHKKGDTRELKNWRPITMANTLYKLYTGCWAARLSKWIQANEALHPAQKGFTPFDGVIEHNFAIKEAISRARSEQTELCVA